MSYTMYCNIVYKFGGNTVILIILPLISGLLLIKGFLFCMEEEYEQIISACGNDCKRLPEMYAKER
jgi:hypothetical protein